MQLSKEELYMAKEECVRLGECTATYYIVNLLSEVEAARSEVKTNTVIELGLGKVSIDRGTCEGVTSVFIEPVQLSGVPGDEGPDLPLDSLQPGSIIIKIHDQRGADVLAENLTPKLRAATDLLKRLVDKTEQGPTGDTQWWRDYFLFTGEHMILTEEGWEPGEEKASCDEADINIFDEVNAPA